MIIKSSQRSDARGLARHLMNADDNEQVEWSATRDLLVVSVKEALQDMEDLARGSRCQKPLYHVSVSPDREMQADDWRTAWEFYEAEYGLQQQPFIEVIHRKKDRLHKHRVYARVAGEGTAIELPFFKLRNEKVSRVLEYAFKHPVTVGKHNRAVITALRRDGLDEVADWLEQQGAANQNRPVAVLNHDDCQQQHRTKVPVNQVKDDLRHAYARTDTGKAFEAAIAELGYVLCRGDRRDFVIVDGAGGLHSPARRLGVKTKDLRTRWADLDVGELPHVEAIRDARNPDRALRRKLQNATPEEALLHLHRERARLDVEILKLRQASVLPPPDSQYD